MVEESTTINDDIDLNEAEFYYRRKRDTSKVIKRNIKRNAIVYGAKAVNANLPSYLRKHTEDWDIYSSKPEEKAKQIEQSLDKHFKGNFFEVKPALHEGTYKVISRVTGEGVADITLNKSKIKYKNIKGIKYATLDEQVKNIKKSLANEDAKFRHKKDKETLQRIQIFEIHTRPKYYKIPVLKILRIKPVKRRKRRRPRIIYG